MSASPSADRHARSRRRSALRLGSRTVLGASLLIVGAILVALTSTGGSFALWRGSATTAAPAVSAGTVAVVTNNFDSVAIAYGTSLLTKTGGIQIVNTGTVDGTYTAAVSLSSDSTAALVSAITVIVWPVSALASCTTTATPVNSWTGLWSGVPAFSGPLAVGHSDSYCLRSTLPSAKLTAVGKVTPTVTVSLKTSSAWGATATASVSQSVIDQSAPSVPGTPVASATTGNSTTLTWTASTDTVGVTGYDIYRGGTKIGTVTTPTFTDSRLNLSTSYSYTVTARDAAGNVSAASGARVVTTTATPGVGSWYQVRNSNGKCEQVTANAVNGSALVQGACSTATNRLWQFVPTSAGYFQVAPKNAPVLGWDVSLDASGSAGGTASGAPVQLWSYGGGTNQQWLPVAYGNGTYYFVSRNSGKCLDVTDSSTVDGKQLQQWDCVQNPNQLFTLVLVP